MKTVFRFHYSDSDYWCDVLTNTGVVLIAEINIGDIDALTRLLRVLKHNRQFYVCDDEVLDDLHTEGFVV